MRPVATAAIVALLACRLRLARPVAPAPPAARPAVAVLDAPRRLSDARRLGGRDAVYAAINEQVRAIRGLRRRRPSSRPSSRPDEMTQVLKDSFSEDYPPDQVAADERLYHGLGLLPKDDKLADLYIDLLRARSPASTTRRRRSCTSSRSRAASARWRRSTSRTSTTTRSRTRTSTSRRSRTGSIDQTDEPSPASRWSRATPTLHDVLLAAAAPDSPRRSARSSRPRTTRPRSRRSTGSRPSSKRRSRSRPSRAPNSSRPCSWAVAGKPSTRVRRSAHLDRADPPPREVHRA